MSGTPIPMLMFAVAFGIAALSHEAGAAPRQGDDGQMVGASESRVPVQKMVALGVRRVAIADPDLDGIVSPAEAERYYETRFALMDRDRDGRLSEPEFFRAGTSRSAAGGGQFPGAAAARFRRDRPGRQRRADAGRVPARRRRAPDLGDRYARRGARRPIFDAADVNGDDALSKRELTEVGSRHFAGSDADGDGRVTIWEFYAGTRF